MSDLACISDLFIFIMGLNNRLTDLVSKTETKTQVMEKIDANVEGLVSKIAALEEKLGRIEAILENPAGSQNKLAPAKFARDKQWSIDIIGPKDDGPFAHVVTEILKRLVQGSDASETYHDLCTIAQGIVDNIELDSKLTRTSSAVRGIIQIFENQSTCKQEVMIESLEKEFYSKYNTSIVSVDSWFAKRIMQRCILDKRRQQLNRESAFDGPGLCLPTIKMDSNSPIARKTNFNRGNLSAIPIYYVDSDENISDSALYALKDRYSTPKYSPRNVRGLARCTGRGASKSTGRGKRNGETSLVSKKIFSCRPPY